MKAPASGGLQLCNVRPTADRWSKIEVQAGDKMNRHAILAILILLVTPACGTGSARALQEAPSSTPYWSFLWPLQTAWAARTPTSSTDTGATSAGPVDTATFTPAVATVAADTPTPGISMDLVPTPGLAPILAVSDTPIATPLQPVTSLKATVTARFLSCRYGPGANYLYLYALRQGANIKLIGRTDGDNWHWAWVDGRNRCWVNISYLSVDGDWRQLPIVYPGIAKLPVSPYYPPTSIVSVVRLGNSVTVEWAPIRLRAGDEEDEFMQHYVLEVWHCVSGNLIFEPLATNYTFLTVLDEPGCTSPSHARLFVQEKHGFSGPTAVPWRSAQ